MAGLSNGVKGRKKFSLSTSMVSASYIVHIYCFKKDNPRVLVGVVEEVGVKGKKAFSNYDELWDILNSQKDSRTRVRSGSKKDYGEKKVILDQKG